MRKLLLVVALVALSVAANAQYRIDKVMSAGRSALYYEDYVLAMQYFNRIISSRPGLYEAWYLRGLAKFHLDDYKGANSDATEAIERNPYIDKIFELRAVARLNLLDYQGALTDFSKARSINPDNRDYWYNRAYCNYQLHNDTLAEQQLDTITQHWRNFAEAYGLRADLSLRTGDTLAATYWLDRSLEANSYNGRLWATLGRLQLLRGQWAQADSSLSQSIHFSPSVAGSYVNRGTARWHEGNHSGALQDFDKAIDLSPGNQEALYNRAVAYRRMGRQHASAGELARMSAPSDKSVYSGGMLVAAVETASQQSANSQLAQGRPATADYRRDLMPMATLHLVNADGGRWLRQITTFSSDYIVYQGSASDKLNEQQSRQLFLTIDTLSLAISKTARIADAKGSLLLRAVAYADAQDYSSAINDLQVYLSIDSTLSEAYAERAFCRLRQAEYEGSDITTNRLIASVVEQDLLNSAALTSDKAVAYYNLGTFYALMDNRQQAIDAFDRALRANPALAEAWLNRGVARLGSSDRAAAVADIEQADALGLPEARTLLARLVRER